MTDVLTSANVALGSSVVGPHDTFDRVTMRQELVRDEGLRLRAYLDTAKPPRRTIGVGRNLDNVGIRPAETHALNITVASCIAVGVTEPQAFYLCDCDITVACNDLDRVFPWWRGLDPVRQRVMLNMTFNMGVGRPKSLIPPRAASGMSAFVNTMAAIQRHDFAAGAHGMEASAWYGQVGARAKRLVNSMLTGVAAS